MVRRNGLYPGAITTFAFRGLLLLSTTMLPKSKAKSSRKSIELKLAVIKRKLPENATTWEKEKAEIPDAKRCKIQRDVKKSVDR